MYELNEDVINQIAEAVASKLRRPDPLLSRKDAAKFLAVTERTLDKLATDGELTKLKFGTKTLFQPSDLYDLIARKAKNATLADCTIDKCSV